MRHITGHVTTYHLSILPLQLTSLVKWDQCAKDYRYVKNLPQNVFNFTVYQNRYRTESIRDLTQYKDVLPVKEIALWRYDGRKIILYPQWNVLFWWDDIFILNQTQSRGTDKRPSICQRFWIQNVPPMITQYVIIIGKLFYNNNPIMLSSLYKIYAIVSSY